MQHLQYVDFQYLFCCKNTFVFTGKEKDSETGFYYFGARYYDPTLSGLFLSVDPMADKYPSISPYAYCAWNPVKIIDPNGEDGVKIINKQEKKITVKANYYVTTVPLQGHEHTSYSEAEVQKMNKEINSLLNNNNYNVSFNGEQFNVVFDLTFIAAGEQFNAIELAKNDPYGNSLTILPSNIVDKILSHKDGDVGGITENAKDIIMNHKYDNIRRKIHEIFHTLFFNNDDADSGIGNYEPGTDLPNYNDIQDLVNNPQLPAIENE